MALSIDVSLPIDAPPAAVWACLSDTGSWPRWSDVLVALDGDREVGARQRLRLRMAGGLPLIATVELTVWTPGVGIEWVGGLPLGLFRARHGFRIEPSQAGATITHYEHFSGLLPWLLGPLLRRLEVRHRRVNEQIRAEVERRAA